MVQYPYACIVGISMRAVYSRVCECVCVCVWVGILGVCVFVYVCVWIYCHLWQLPSNLSFYREIVGYGMGVGDQGVSIVLVNQN